MAEEGSEPGQGWEGLAPSLTFPPRVWQRLRGQVEGHQPVFSTLEADLAKASEVNERMVRGHSERDLDLDRYRDRVQQLLDRWQAALAQIDLRQRELDQLGRQLRYYRNSYGWLIEWIQDARQRQEGLQAVPITSSQRVREQLLQEKVRLAKWVPDPVGADLFGLRWASWCPREAQQQQRAS